MRDLSRPGSLDASFFLDNCHDPDGVGDTQLADLASPWIEEQPATFTFVYFGHTDIAGHGFGWMSEPYLQAIENADRCIGSVVDVLAEDTIVVVTADHGGHQKAHGTDYDEDMLIPFIISGPGILSDCPIERAVEITDIAPTILDLLGLKVPEKWTGEAISFG